MAWVKQQQQQKKVVIQPKCVADPATGQCDSVTVSIGGQYIVEPVDSINWCGPGAGEAAYLHWNSSAVYNHSTFNNVTMPDGATQTLTGASGLAWMYDFAHLFAVKNSSGGFEQNGVLQTYAHGGADATILRDGMNGVTGTQYYVYYNPPNGADMMGNVEYDLNHDGRPMIYLANTNYLATWKSGLNINHYVEGYGYIITVGGVTYASYADTAPHTDNQQNQPGDYTISEAQMWQAVSSAYWIDSSGVHHPIAVIIM